MAAHTARIAAHTLMAAYTVVGANVGAQLMAAHTARMAALLAAHTAFRANVAAHLIFLHGLLGVLAISTNPRRPSISTKPPLLCIFSKAPVHVAPQKVRNEL